MADSTRVNDSSSNILPNSIDTNVLMAVGREISPMIFENIKIYAAQEQRFDSLRNAIYAKLNHLSKRITVADDNESQAAHLEEKCAVLSDIQECLYDLQLVEHASKIPVFALTKAVFSLNKNRCVHKAPAAKIKPSKKQKLETALARDIRRADRERKSPSVLKNSNDDLQSLCNGGDESSVQEGKRSTAAKRRSNRDKNASAATNSFKNEAEERNGRSETQSADNNLTEGGGGAQSVDSKHDSANGNDELSRIGSPNNSHQMEILAPRRRAAAVAAAASVSETMNPQRSSSPRKRHFGNSSSNNRIDDDNDNAMDISPDEPTYCICEQISFGEMICCDYAKCPIEWFHFSCVNIKIKPKGKKWYCPTCRGDKPTVLKTSLQSKRGNNNS